MGLLEDPIPESVAAPVPEPIAQWGLVLAFDPQLDHREAQITPGKGGCVGG